MQPKIDWTDTEQWEKVYKPSSDSFFLTDGIKKVFDSFPYCPSVLEIGSGSGYVTAFTRMLFASKGLPSLHFTTDINPECCKKTREICTNNDVLVAPTRDKFCEHLRGPFDIIIFNPPYVETSNEELEDAIKKESIEASWAGGEDGAVVVYDCLDFIVNHREKFSENFIFVLLLASVNRPMKIKRWCRNHGLDLQIILKQQCQGEALLITTITPMKSE